jgi:hypothetical protein
LKSNKVNLFVSSVLFVFWYHSPNFLDTPGIFQKKVKVLFVLVIYPHVSALLQFSLCFCTARNCHSNRIPFPFIGCFRIDQLDVKVFAVF